MKILDYGLIRRSFLNLEHLEYVNTYLATLEIWCLSLVFYLASLFYLTYDIEQGTEKASWDAI